MALLPLEIFNSFTVWIDFRRQKLTSKVNPRTERVSEITAGAKLTRRQRMINCSIFSIHSNPKLRIFFAFFHFLDCYAGLVMQTNFLWTAVNKAKNLLHCTQLSLNDGDKTENSPDALYQHKLYFPSSSFQKRQLMLPSKTNMLWKTYH